MSTLDQGVRQADVLTDNLSAIAAQNQEANRNANLEVSSVEQLADSSLSSVQAQAQLSNFASITTSSKTTSTSSSSTTALTLAAAQTSATQQSTRTNSSGSCCCFDQEDPQVLEVTLEDVAIRYGYDAFNQWESEIYAFVIGRVSINIPLASTFTVLMNFGGNYFEVTIPSSLKNGGPGWYSAVVDVDDPWPPPYHQVFAKGTSLGQASFCEEKILRVTGYRLGNDPFGTFEKRVSGVELPDPVSLTVCPYIGTLGIQEAKNNTNVVATISVDYLPFILPLRVGVAYGDASWRSDVISSGGSISIGWVWQGGGPAPGSTPQILEVTVGTAQYRYFNIYGSPTNSSSSVYWAWDVFSKQYQLQLALLDWRWNGDWEYVGPRWSNYYTEVIFWDDGYEPSPPGSPPNVIFPEPEAVTATFGKGADCYSTWVAYSINGGYSLTVLPPKTGAGCPSPGAHVLIANVNEAKDDNFNIYLNGIFLGPANLGQDNVKQAVLFIWSATQEIIDQVQVMYNIEIPDLIWTVKTIDGPAPAPGSPAIVSMENTGNNNNGNFGRIFVGFLDSKVSDEYSGTSGSNLSASLTFPR